MAGAVNLTPIDYTISADRYFGCSVSVFGDYAIIGADGDNQSTGAAYIFQRTGADSWAQQQKLTAGEYGAPSDRFGASVAISGDYAIIGVPYSDDDKKGSNIGSAYIFKREGATWIQDAQIMAEDAAPNDFFGGSVSLYGDYAIIGSAYNDDNGSESGSAYVFRREGSDWIQQTKLLPDDGASYDYFGVSVAISGSGSEWYAIIGAHTHNDPFTNTSFGAAYIFGLDEDVNWVQQDKFMPDDSASGDQFGISVAISGTSTSGWHAIVGADGDDDMGSEAGSAYIFARNKSTWTQQNKLTPPETSAGDHFGRSVAISGDYAIVGASGDDDNGSNAGAAYLFHWTGGNWEQQEKRTEGTSGDLFGDSVSISGSYAIAGAPGDSNDSGSVSIGPGDPNPRPIPPTILNPGEQTTPKNELIDIFFTVYDPDTPAANIKVSAASDNTGVVPNDTAHISIRYSAAEAGYFLTLVPTQLGVATITITADDPEHPAESVSFTLTVNNPPVINGLDETVVINENDYSKQIIFSVSNATQITVSGRSSNTELVPNSHIKFTGSSPSNQAVTITPAAGATGSADITVTVRDSLDGDTVSKTFTFIVNGAPDITGIPSQATTQEDMPYYINFTVDDQTVAAGFDIFTMWSSAEMSEGSLKLSGTGANRRLTITPPSNEFGTAQIGVAVQNPSGATTTKTLFFEVTPVNDKPDITGPESALMNEDGTADFIFEVGDVDDAPRGLTVTALSSDPELIPNANIKIKTPTGSDTERILTITPVGFGTADITVTVSDGELDDNIILALTVNARPLIEGPSESPVMDEDTPTTFTFEVSDPDAPGDSVNSLSLSAVSGNSMLIPNNPRDIRIEGTGPARAITLTPSPNQFGNTEITVTVTDDKGARRLLQFFLNVNPVNDLPVVSWIGPQQGSEDGWTDSIPFSVTDAEGGNLSVSVISGDTTLIPNSGSNIRISNIGVTNYSIYGEPGVSVPMNLKFLPDQDQFGVSEITVEATDEQNAKGKTIFTMTIGAANDPPTLSNIEDQITDEDTRTPEIPFTVGDKDPDMLTISVSSDNTELIPLSGIRVIGVDSASQVAAAATLSLRLTLTPAPDQSGSAEITVNVDDGTDTVSDTFTLTVTSVNDPPEIADIETSLIVTEDTSDSFSFTVSDPDTPLAYVQVTAVSSNEALVPSQYVNLHTDGTGSVRTLVVKPAKDADTNALGTTYITLTADDGQGRTAERRVSLRVTSVNDAPEISGTPESVVNEEELYSFAPEASDIDNDISELIFTIEHKPSWAGFNTTTGVLSGTPGDSDVGKTTGILITVRDPSGEEASLPPFDIEVLNVNDPPTVSEIGNQVTDEDTPTDAIRFSVSDTEGGRLLITASSSDTNLIPDNAIDIGGLGPNYVVTTLPGETRELSLVLSPAANQNGTATITLSINDGEDETPAPFYIMVRPVNDEPELSLIPNQDTKECTEDNEDENDEDSCVVKAAFTVIDPEGGTLTISAVSDNPTLVPNTAFDIIGADTQGRVNASPDQPADLTLKITPARGESGATFVTVTARDESETDTVTFLLTVDYVNKRPQISDIQTYATEEDTPVDVTFTVTDIEGGNFPISVQSSDTVRVPNDPEHISIIPEGQAGGFGPDYVLSMQPQGGNPATQDVTVRIVPAENQSGPVEFSVKVTDSGGDVEATFFVTISRVNDPPVISGLGNQNTDENVAIENIPFTVMDSEGGMFDGGKLSLTVTSSNEELLPADGDHIVINTVPPSGSGFGTSYSLKLSPGAEKELTLSLTPAQDAAGESEITVTADDGSGTETAISETVFLFSVNNEPAITGLYNRTTPEDEPIDVIFTIADVEGGALAVSAKSENETLLPNDPEHISINDMGPDAVIMMGPDDIQYPVLKLTPASDQSGTTKITITLQTGDEEPINEVFYLTVTPQNDGPTIEPIPNATMDECQWDDESCETADDITVKVKDMEGGWITLSAVSSSNTTLLPNDDANINIGGFGTSFSESLNAGESFSETLTLRPEYGVIPAGQTYAEAQITVTAADEDGGWNQRNFTLRVTRVNKPPEISGIWDQNMTEDDPKKDVIFRISDDEGGEFHIKVESNDTNLFPEDYGHLNIQGYGPQYLITMSEGGSYADLTLSLTPASEAFGAAIITVSVTDGPLDAPNHEPVKKQMVVNVRPENDGPSVSAIPNQTTSEGQATGNISFTVSDPEGGLLDISVTSSDTALVPEDDVHINIDGFGREHTVSPAPGTNVGLSLVLTPAEDAFGTADITVSVSDQEGETDSKTFKLMVGVVNEPPILSGFSSQITKEDTPSGNIPFTVSDAEGGALSLSVVSSNPSVVPNDDMHIQIIHGEDAFGASYILNLPEGAGPESLNLNIVPAENQSGSVRMTVTVQDGDTSDVKEFILKIDPVNDPPEVSDIPNQTTGMGVSTQAIPFTVSDSEGGMFAGGMVKISITSTNHTLVPEDIDHITIGEGFGLVQTVRALPGQNVGLSLTVTPAEGQYGETYINVTVDDGSGDSLSNITEKSFHLKVTGEPILSVFGNSNQTMEEDKGPLDIPFTASGAEGGCFSISVTSSNDALVPENAGNLSIDGFGTNYHLCLPENQSSQDFTLTVTPPANAHGEAMLRVAVEQGEQQREKNFYLVVKSVNDVPTISEIFDKTTGENTPIDVSFVIRDTETPVNELVIDVDSSDAGLTPSDSMVLGGSGDIRTLKITPAPNKVGDALITVTVNDGTTDVSESFRLTVEQINMPPEISSIPSPQNTSKNTAAVVQFRASDTETPAKDLVISGFSSNTTLVPNANISPAIYLGDSATPNNYQIKITPANERLGDVSLTLRVSDGVNTVETTFALQVTGEYEDHPPEIYGSFVQRSSYEDEDEVIRFTIDDEETSVGDLDVNVRSDKPDLVPNENIVLERSGSNCTVTLTPLKNGNGTVNITVEVSDGTTPTVVKFPIEIIPINDRPTIDPPFFANQIIEEGENTEAVSFTVADVETAAKDLDITISSSDTRLVPEDNIYLACVDPEADCPKGNYRLVAIPMAGRSGTSEITVKVHDGGEDNNAWVESSFFITVGDVLPGDLNGDDLVDLHDAILGLKTLTGINVNVILKADVNGDNRIGMADVLYILEIVSE